MSRFDKKKAKVFFAFMRKNSKAHPVKKRPQTEAIARSTDANYVR